MPSRVTLNDSKRQAWFADLANPHVPLYKLGKSVPHGAKGHDLLDLLHSNNVAIPRAVWFLRVFGANETVRKLALFMTYLHLLVSFIGWSEKQTLI
jgi:mediator of RNA polymerase II transcription subunit 12, fungi type